MAAASVIIVPGLGGSGPDHWQTRWERLRPGYRRVAQADWHDPSPTDWWRALDSLIVQAAAPVVLVAHSLGCLLVAHWARGGAVAAVAGAMLVAPCDPDRNDACAAIRRFAPAPVGKLPFASILVASRDDPYATPARTRDFAASWGSQFIDVGARGHINAASGLGDWPFGHALLDQLTGRVAR